jgi:glyoxylate reductase
VLTDAIDRAVIDAAPRLKVVANVAVGYNNIDVSYARSRGIVVTNTPDVLTDSVADFTWGLILALTRRLAEGDRLVRSGGWTGWTFDFMLGTEVKGKQLGLVGFGRIARAVCRRAQAFGLRVLAWSPSLAAAVAAEHGAEAVTLERLFRESDYVSLHVPATAETRGLVDKERLRLLRPTAWLINTGRGALVDEAALLQALESGRLAGAALDVRESEPPGPDDRLGRLPNVILTPHSAYYSRRAVAELKETAVRNVVSVLQGRPPISPVNPGVTPKAAR